MSKSAGVSRKAEEAYLTGAPGPCYHFLVESKLLTYFCYFVCIMSCSLLYVSVFNIWFLSLDYILLISSRILVPLITLLTNLNGCITDNLRLFFPLYEIVEENNSDIFILV